MKLPFSHEQFLDVFAAYNRLLWPVAVLLWLATLLALVSWWRRGAASSPVLAGLLAIHWAWSGIAYHFAFFRAINPAAIAFATVFVAQAVLLAWMGVLRRRLVFSPSRSGWGLFGVALAVYALAYPGMGLLTGLSYPRMPTFGVPCPTTILTAGLLALQGAPFGATPGFAEPDPEVGVTPHAGGALPIPSRVLLTGLASGGAAGWLVLERS